MQDRLFNPSNEWHEYKGCRLLRARAVFAARQGFVYVDHPHVKEIHLVDVTDTSESDEPPAMVAGYIVLSARTTLAVFRGILPGTTRFFFLSVPLLRLVRELRRPAPSWCAGVLCGMQLLVENNCINKGPVDCMQNMSGYYTGLACLILFDARGATDHGLAFTIGAACGAVLLLSLKFIPLILHRPQQLVDTLCNDILCITAHAVCIGTVVDPALRHGCALHSACFIAQHRFIGCMPSLATTTMVHTMLILLLLAAYTHGPRIPDVHRFMLSAVCPHALELLAQLLTHAHRVAVIAAADT
jgi:hypothetical protein